VGIDLHEFMAIEMIREADVLNKGYLTLKEFEMAIFAAARQSRMLKAIVNRWKQDSKNYEALPPPEGEGVFKNIETETEVHKVAFVNNVERAKFDNSDTRRRKPKTVSHTWTGNPIYTDEDLQNNRPKTIKARQLLDNMLRHSHVDSHVQRLPLHFCCASAHPEAAVMVRDLLATYQRAAQIKDQNGRMPLHLACMNESYTSATMVRLLVLRYPSAARIRDRDGNLPLHLCLLHNHGDAALEVVQTLLEVYPKAAAVSYGEQYLAGRGGEDDLAIHLALKHTSVHAADIISRLVDAYPEALMRRGDGGVTLLHRFCWIKHPCPKDIQRALEMERGINKWLRAPMFQQSADRKSHSGQEPSGQYSAVAKLKTILRLARKNFPHSLNQLDANGALPIHYLCQIGGPCAHELLSTLIELHPHSMIVQDGRGNSPLHLTIGCNHAELSESLAHEASIRNWLSKLTLPNARDQLPSQVAGAWRVRSIFKMDSDFDRVHNILQALLSPILAGLSCYLISDYVPEQKYGHCSLLATPFALFSIIWTSIDLYEIGFTRDVKKIREVLKSTLLQICQVRIPMIVFRNLITGRPPSRSLLQMKAVEMIVVALPLSILNVFYLIDEYDGAGEILAGTRRSIQAALTCLSWLMLAFAATEHESHRFWGIPHIPTLRYWEIWGAFLFRAAESSLRILNFATFAFIFGPGFLCLLWCFEICLMIIIAGKVRELVTDNVGYKAFKIVYPEIFDLCGTFHPFDKGAEVDVVLGRCGMYDAVLKTVVKLGIQLVIFGLLINKLVFSSDQASIWWPITYVAAACGVACGQILFFAFHYWLMQVRKRHLGTLRKMTRLQAWSFPLFDKMPQDFLNSAEELLITCSYEPGDHIMRQGEYNEVVHLLVKGSVSVQDAYEVPKKASLMRSLSKATSRLSRKMSIKSAASNLSFSGSIKKLKIEAPAGSALDGGDTPGSASPNVTMMRQRNESDSTPVMMNRKKSDGELSLTAMNRRKSDGELSLTAMNRRKSDGELSLTAFSRYTSRCFLCS